VGTTDASMTIAPRPEDDQPPAVARSARRRRPTRWQRWTDQRTLRRTISELEEQHVVDVQARLQALARSTVVVSRIALVENRPTLRLLQIDFDADVPSLLASVDPATIAALAALRLPALLLVQDVARRRQGWAIELATLDQSVTLAADEVVAADGLHRAAAEGWD
jgi:hypothetical protein